MEWVQFINQPLMFPHQLRCLQLPIFRQIWLTRQREYVIYVTLLEHLIGRSILIHSYSLSYISHSSDGEIGARVVRSMIVADISSFLVWCQATLISSVAYVNHIYYTYNTSFGETSFNMFSFSGSEFRQGGWIDLHPCLTKPRFSFPCRKFQS